MGLEAHLNKESVLYFAAKNAARRPYEYKRGPQARTLFREMRLQQEPQSIPSNEYPKELEGLWDAKTLVNSIYDNQNHEDDKCSCKCTAIPNEIHARHSERKEKEAV